MPLELFHQPTLMHNFLYSLTIRLLHYYPLHVSSINMPTFRRKDCIHTASGIFALCKRLHSTLVLLMNKENCALKLVNEIILYYGARSKKNIKLVHLVGFITNKFVTMHGHMNVKIVLCCFTCIPYNYIKMHRAKT